jgi:cyclophilin family peptidyl-prolyl cis-trans isomerase
MGRAQKLKKQRKIERIENETKKRNRNRLIIKGLSLSVVIGLVGWISYSGAILFKKKYFPPKAGQEAAKVENKENKYTKAPEMTIDVNKTYLAKFETNQGNFEISLNAKDAPKTVNNFVFLAKDKFYDGLTFHRIVKDFMIQGGDPKGDGTSGPGYKFDDEEIKGDYAPGTVAMANSGKNTNGSQFFIMTGDYSGGKLPKEYVIFGKVTNGMEVVEKIAAVKTADNGQGEQSKPDEKQTINKVTIEEK